MYSFELVLRIFCVFAALFLPGAATRSVSNFDWLDLRNALYFAGVVNATNSFQDYERERRLGILMPPECPFDGPGWCCATAVTVVVIVVVVGLTQNITVFACNATGHMTRVTIDDAFTIAPIQTWEIWIVNR